MKLIFEGFLFGVITGGINNTGAVWGATDSWPTIEMQSRYVHCLMIVCFNCCIHFLIIIIIINLFVRQYHMNKTEECCAQD